jgi:Protein of unknown function (DUF4058)
MPLRDHFRPPLSEQRPWESFHSGWINSIADALNEALPEGYFADAEVHAGASAEIDVATFGEEAEAIPSAAPSGNGPPVAVLSEVVAPALSIDVAFADDFEVKVYRELGGARLVAALELISPRNKDRAEARAAFATKCASYLYNGVAVVIVDIVTARKANLHDEIMATLSPGPIEPAGEDRLYAVAYRPIRRGSRSQVDVWPHGLTLGQLLPRVPLWLSAVRAIPIDLEATYMQTIQRRRLG